MRSRKKNFTPDALQHIYQRNIDCGVIFYTMEDRLVYYTTAAVNAVKHEIVVYAGAIMFTHIHQSCQAKSKKQLESYLHDTDTSFARAYNHKYQRHGKLFREKPGIAQKKSDKDKRTNIIYVLNNHVEKKLCQTASDEQWCFLAYALSESPFSVPIQNPSPALRQAMALVDRRKRRNQILRYKDLHRIFQVLDDTEKKQFIDYTIVKYAWVNHRATMSFFGDMDALLVALNSTTGSEYGQKEDYYNAPDTPFVSLIKMAESQAFLKRIYTLDKEEKADLIIKAANLPSVRVSHLTRFFHQEIVTKNL